MTIEATIIATTPEDRRPTRTQGPDSLHTLLNAYDATFTDLRAVERLPSRKLDPAKRLKAFVLRWGARYFMIYGVRHTIHALRRRTGVRLSLQPKSETDLDWLERLERYESALPSVPAKRILLIAVALAGFLGYLVGSVLPDSIHA